MKINIAIDGPAGSGKGITSKLLAKKLEYKTLDSGAMYRGVTLYFNQNNLDYKKFQKEWLNNIKLSFSKDNHLLLNGVDVEDKIRTPKIGIDVAPVSNIIEIREFLIKQQQEIIKNKGYVLEGRDATTIIAPNAELKIYLDCDVDERVRRRLKDFESKGIKKGFEELKQDIIRRDENDKNKGKYSLRIAENAIIIDTTNLTIEEQVKEIHKLVIVVNQ